MTTPAQLPTYDQAYDTVFDKVHAEVFFKKLASANLVPADQDQAIRMLQLAAELRETEQLQPKQANDWLSSAEQALHQGRQQLGINSTVQARQQAHSIKQAALQLAHHPEIYNSIVALQLHDEEAAAAA